MAITKNLYIDQGSEFYEEFPLTDANKVALNLSTFTALAYMKKSYNSVDFVDLGANIPNPSGGIVAVYLTDDITKDLAPGRYVYDLVIIETTTNKKVRVSEGIVVVNPGVTL